MNILEKFKQFLSANPQLEQFEKMFEKENYAALKEAGAGLSVLFKKLGWEDLLAADKIAALESQVKDLKTQVAAQDAKINKLMDAANQPAIPTPTTVTVKKID